MPCHDCSQSEGEKDEDASICHLKTNIDNLMHSFIMSTNSPQQSFLLYDCCVDVKCGDDGLTCASMSTEGYRGSMEGGETVLMGVCTEG